MAFSIGANDACNGLATSYGSNALGLYPLVIGGAIAEFVGAMWCSGGIVSSLPTKIIPRLYDESEEDIKKIMFAVSCASFLFIMTSSFSGMPISGTHTVIGALLGAGIVATTMHNPFRWHKLGGILFYWFASPLCGAMIAFLLMIIVSKYTLNTSKYSFRRRIYAL